LAGFPAVAATGERAVGRDATATRQRILEAATVDFDAADLPSHRRHPVVSPSCWR
jgi:hypothetical protein